MKCKYCGSGMEFISFSTMDTIPPIRSSGYICHICSAEYHTTQQGDEFSETWKRGKVKEDVELKIGDPLLITQEFIDHKKALNKTSENYLVDGVALIRSRDEKGNYGLRFPGADTFHVPSDIVRKMRKCWLALMSFDN